MVIINQPNLKSQTLPNNEPGSVSKNELINTIPVKIPAIRYRSFLFILFSFYDVRHNEWQRYVYC